MGIFDFIKSVVKHDVKENKPSENDLNDISGINKNVGFPNRDEIDRVYSRLFDGLLIGEIVFLDWANGKSVSAVVPGYFSYIYGINWINSEKKLIECDMLRYGEAFEGLIALKVSDLKRILEEHNLPKTGKKAQLIETIKGNVTEKDYSSLVPKTWKLTHKGELIIQKYHHVIWAHNFGSNSSVVNPGTMILNYQSPESSEELALGLSEKAIINDIKNLNYGLARINLSYQAKIKQSTGDFLGAVDAALLAVMLELTGVGNTGNNGYIFISEHAVSANGLKATIIENQAKLEIGSDQILSRAKTIYTSYDKQLSQVRLFRTQKEFVTGLDILLNGTLDDFNSLISKWYKRLPEENKI